MREEVKKGHCLGPFAQCPFPSTWCSKQAIICQLFFIPKHKFLSDGRFAEGYEYFTFQHFLRQIRRLGRNTLVSLFDIKDAYKNCRVKTSHLWQQVYKVDRDFYVDLGGMFGSTNTGDSWNLVMEFLISTMRARLPLAELSY